MPLCKSLINRMCTIIISKWLNFHVSHSPKLWGKFNCSVHMTDSQKCKNIRHVYRIPTTYINKQHTFGTRQSYHIHHTYTCIQTRHVYTEQLKLINAKIFIMQNVTMMVTICIILLLYCKLTTNFSTVTMYCF